MRTSSRAGVRLEKIPDSQLSVNKQSKHQGALSVDPMDRSLDFGSKSMMMDNNNVSMSLKNQKISPMEQNFIKEYRHLEELEREKGIKFF
jgi:hypothetical protein